MKKLFQILFVALSLCSAAELYAFETFTVQKIKVEGAQRISDDAVLRDLGISLGDKVTPERANSAIHDLYKTGFFKDIQLERDGSALIVKVLERPSIAKLELVGLKNKEDVEKILKANGVAEGRVYDPNVISKVEREIIHKYLTEQRYGVRVEANVTPESRNRVNLDIHIYEGNVATIKQISFVGNKAFTAKKLRRQMYHKTRNLLSWLDKSDHYSKEKLQADLEMLRSFYMDRGYLDFTIESTQVSLSVDKKHVYVTISLSEGDPYYFKPAVVTGDIVLDSKELQSIVDQRIKGGAVFSRKMVWETKEALENRLGDAGYSKAQARIVDDVDQDTRQVSLKFYIDAHKRITVRRISFEGNGLTQDQVLRRELEQFEGTWISTSKVREGKEAIQRNGYATKVDIETIPVLDKDDQVDLLYKIEEQRNANLSAGISYSGADRFSLNLGADLKNYLGTGKDINFMFNHGKSVQTYSLGYSDAYFTDSGIGFGGNLYNQRTQLSKTSNVFDYALDATGMNMVWQFRISKYNFFKIGGGYDYTILKINYSSAPEEAKSFVRAYVSNIPARREQQKIGLGEGFINGGLIHNSLDSYLFPTRGLTSSLEAKWSIPGGDIEFYRVDLAASWFNKVYKNVVFNLRTDAGYSDVYNDRPYPFYRHYYLGGGESVRGYGERSLGPRDSQNNPFGGNILLQARAQFIFPPPFEGAEDSMRLALFLDAGQVYDTHNKKDQFGNVVSRGHSGLRYSAGVSFTWYTPMQVPIAFSLAYPLNRYKGNDNGLHADDKKLFTFSMGTGF